MGTEILLIGMKDDDCDRGGARARCVYINNYVIASHVTHLKSMSIWCCRRRSRHRRRRRRRRHHRQRLCVRIIEIYATAIHLVFSFARFIASPSVIKRCQNVSSIYCCTWISWIHMDKQICILASSFHSHFALSCGAATLHSPRHCDTLHVLCVGWYLSQIKSPDKNVTHASHRFIGADAITKLSDRMQQFIVEWITGS